MKIYLCKGYPQFFIDFHFQRVLIDGTISTTYAKTTQLMDKFKLALGQLCTSNFNNCTG